MPAIADSLRRLAERPCLVDFLSYTSSPGLRRHRQAGAAWLARVGLEVLPERIVMCSGAQQGLALRGHPASFHVMVELPPPWRSEAFAEAARERGVTVVPLTAFSLAAEPPLQAVRVSLSAAPDRPALARALATLRMLAMETPRTRRDFI